jgi:acyl-CoA reductase-like NAD-dependent aldehyde dehydrogenase
METRLLIAGEQVAGEGPGLDVENPYAQTTLATVALPSAEQVDAAIGAARAAARGWADEAIALANSTRFGLGANVYTRDLETVVRCMREIKAGTVWFNDPLTDNDAGPFGGYKQSGLGRELGQEGLEAFQETKHVHIETKIAAKSWWYPYGTSA